MAKKIRTTLGGDRLGSGNRQKIEMHNYFRSNHNLSCTRISSMAPGVLYPMYTNIGLTGDTFDIDLSAFVRTLPTEGPLFGAFKLQVDVFSADMRLYQAILHNNTTEIGYHMDQVLMPKMIINTHAENKSKRGAFNKSSLMYYLGMAGAGRSVAGNAQVQRKINALPMLAYYDIFKNYYSNKQEENAYVIVTEKATVEQSITARTTAIYTCTQPEYDSASCTLVSTNIQNQIFNFNPTLYTYVVVKGENLTYIDQNGNRQVNITLARSASNTQTSYFRTDRISDTEVVFEYVSEDQTTDAYHVIPRTNNTNTLSNEGIRLQEFPLKNIDKMRKRLLTAWDLGEEVVIDQNEELLPYQSVVGTREHTEIAEGYQLSKNCDPLQGLVVKCYQSDWFNNWLDNEYVDMVTEKSNVAVTNGTFSIDALNFAKKLYDHYNRIAVTGGTYDDWQKAAYGMVHYGKTEKPIYHGGMSSEVIFDEVVSSAQTTDADGKENPLGSLGGRGALKGSRGGHVIVKCNEPCVLMVMVSLTPRLTYTQGNAWYLTELDSINDLHQPDFDRIGFQDLMTEQLAWWDTQIDQQGNITRSAIGKQPAWLQYQTDVNKCFADFAEEDGKGFMVLQRLYDQDTETGGVADVTTYIDPTKYNYAFAVTDLTAQNFWTFLNLDIKARRLMSAKQMPNV